MDTKHKVISEFVPVSAVLRASRLLSHVHSPIPHSVQRAKKRNHGKSYTTCWLKPKVNDRWHFLLSSSETGSGRAWPMLPRLLVSSRAGSCQHSRNPNHRDTAHACARPCFTMHKAHSYEALPLYGQVHRNAP
jgi:hypothetical protein